MTVSALWKGPLPASNCEPNRIDPMTGLLTDIDSIVLHTMDGWASGADARFHNPLAQVSAHYGVRLDGSMWQWVPEDWTAYHAGLYFENLRSVGIEHEDGGDYNGVRPDVLYTASAALVADLCRTYAVPCLRGTGGPGIYDHRDIIKTFGTGTPTACPDALDTDRIIREAAALLEEPMTEADFARIQTMIDASTKAINDKLDSGFNTTMPIQQRRVVHGKDPFTGIAPVQDA